MKKQKDMFQKNAISYIVEKLQSKFSTPGMRYIQIEDACYVYPDEAKTDNDKEGNEDEALE